MTEYRVPVHYEVTACAYVEADSPEEAMQLVREGVYEDLHGYNDGELEVLGADEWEG